MHLLLSNLRLFPNISVLVLQPPPPPYTHNILFTTKNIKNYTWKVSIKNVIILQLIFKSYKITNLYELIITAFPTYCFYFLVMAVICWFFISLNENNWNLIILSGAMERMFWNPFRDDFLAPVWTVLARTYTESPAAHLFDYADMTLASSHEAQVDCTLIPSKLYTRIVNSPNTGHCCCSRIKTTSVLISDTIGN